MKAEKRQQMRIQLEGYSADIADGPFVYGGIVEDAITTANIVLNYFQTRL